MANQEIKIPVSAKTDHAEKGLGNVQRVVEGVADSFGDVDKAAAAAAASIRRVVEDSAKLARIRDLLQREIKQPVSISDATAFATNFEHLRRRRGAIGRNARLFDDAESWLRGYGRLYSKPGERARYRNSMLATGLQGTDVASPPPEPPGGGGGGGSRDDFSHGSRRAGGMAMSFGRSMLALAGIGSVMGMANRAVNLATEEATGIDTLKRRMGDLGVDFDRLRDQARGAAEGLGVTYVESMRLSRAYADEVGNLSSGDLAGNGLQNRMRNAYGFARSFGSDPGSSVQFFAQMSRYGAGRDEQSQRRLALLIGDSIATSGYGGKVDELLRAVADYTSLSARVMLTSPNVGGYLSGLTSLSSRGIPGLDPANAAALLGTADQATRRGGAMGDASMSFMYAALRNANPGISPVQAIAMMEGGLFGTSRSTFGPGSALAGYGKGVALDDTTNFDKMMPLLRSMYGSGGYFLNAVKNTFGLQSHAQAAALAGMSDKGVLGASMSAIGAAGINPMSLNGTGLQMVSALANAKGRGGIAGAFGGIMSRSDLSDAQKKALAAAMAGTSGLGDDETRSRLIQAVSKLDLAQEKTPGTEVRDAITDLTDKLTQAGGPLLSVLNPIRDAVVALAEGFLPGYMDSSGTHSVERRPGQLGKPGSGMAGTEKEMMSFLMGQGWTRIQAAAILGSDMAESSPNLDPLAFNKNHFGIGQWDKRRRKNLKEWAAQRGLSPNDRMTQVAFQSSELKEGGELPAGQYLKGARTIETAAAAMLRSVRPEHFDPLHPERAALYGERLAQTARLAKTPEAPGQPAAGGTHHVVDVNVRHPDGTKQTHTLKLPGAPTKPRPAGAAPLVGGTLSYPINQAYGG